jgi:hypothetical protein
MQITSILIEPYSMYFSLYSKNKYFFKKNDRKII